MIDVIDPNKCSSCLPDSLDEDSIKNKIVLCDKGPKGYGGGADGSAIGIILTGKKVVDDLEEDQFSCATAYVSLEDNSNIHNYIDKTR